MRTFTLAALALALIAFMPVSAQTGVPVENALVVVVGGQDDPALQSILAAGGPPSGIRKALEAAEGLLSASAPAAATGDGGRFEISVSLAKGTYDVAVFAPGFVTSSERVAVDGSGANLTVFMQPSAMVSGRVTDGQGRPIPGIVVAASSPHSANYDVTMDDGVFLLDTGLDTGRHDIYAFKPGADAALLGLPGAEPGLFSKVPSAFRADGAGYQPHVSSVQLEQGKLTTLNIQLESSHAISGRVTDEEGRPVPDAAVLAFDGSGALASAAVTGPEGHYALDNGLAPGTYTVVVPSLFGNGHAPASASVAVPAQDTANFALERSAGLSGRVLDAAGRPVEGAAVFAISDGLDLDGMHLAGFLAGGMASAETDRDGRFSLDGGIGNETYVVTASFGAVPVSSSAQVRAGGHADIVLDFVEMITISGRVTDGSRPIENASVTPGFASATAGAGLLAPRTSPGGEFELTIPIRDNSTRSLFDEIAVSAEGYRSATARGNATVVLERMPAATITGVVMAQKPASPPVETVLTRNGTIVFEHEGAKYGVGVQTNSRVLGTSFDPPGRSITISLEGVQGAAGLSEFLVPKEFIAGPFAVSLDGRMAEGVSAAENRTHAMIAVEHDHDLREITIQGATAVPEFPLPAVAAAAGLAAAVAWMRLRR